MKLMKRLLILLLGIAIIIGCKAQEYDNEGYPEGYPRLRSVGYAWNGVTVDHINKSITRANFLTQRADSLWWGYNWEFNEATTGYFLFYNPITKQITYDDTTGFAGGGGGSGFWERMTGYIQPSTIHDDIRPNGISNLGVVGDPFTEAHVESYFGTWLGDLIASSRIDIALSGKTYNGVNLSTNEGVNDFLNGQGNYVEVRNFDSLIFNSFVSDPVNPPAGFTWWNDDEFTLNIATGRQSVIQVAQEDLWLIYNNTAGAFSDGQIVHIGGGATDGTVHANLAQANEFENCDRIIAVVTGSIPPGEKGFVTTRGKVRDVNTVTVGLGKIYLSPDVPGGITLVEPQFPNYVFEIGGVTVYDAIDGVIDISIQGEVSNTLHNFWNGTFRETFNFTVSSNATIVTGYLTPANGNDNMTMIFSDGLNLLITDPNVTVELTPGTDINPQMNYVHIPLSTKVLTVLTSDWPVEEHIKVAKVYLQSAPGTQTSGALRDHVQSIDGMGHLSHIADRIRSFDAQYHSGVAPTMSVVQGTPDIVYFANTSGKVRQLHLQSFPAYDQALGDELFVINDPATAYERLTEISHITVDALNQSLNNKSFSVVIWGVVNKTGQESHIMLNLPSGSYGYNSPDDAEADVLKYANYNIPNDYKGVGFLIAKYNIKSFNGQWEIYSLEDLRGKVPNSSAGGGTVGGGGATDFTALDDTPSSYTGHAAKYLIVNGAETGVDFSSDAGAYIAMNGLTLNGNAMELGGFMNRNTDIYNNGFGLFIGAISGKSGFHSLNSGESYLTATSGDFYTRSFVGTRFANSEYEAYMISDNYFYGQGFTELIVQDNEVSIAFDYNSVDPEFVLTETSLKIESIPEAAASKVLYYDPITFQITYDDPTGGTPGDSIQGSTIYHAKADRQYFMFGKGGTVTTTDILGVLEIDEDSIVFDEIKIECTGASADMDLRLFHGPSWTAGSGGTPIQAAINVVTGAESTSTVFTIDKLPPGDDIWCMPTTVTTTSEMLIFKLFYHEIDGN